MSYDVGAAGMFGIRLSEHADRLGGSYADLLQAMENWKESAEDDECFEDEAMMEIGKAFGPRINMAFEAAGIRIPQGAYLESTDTDEVRPGQTDTPGGDWIMGFGLFTSPWEFPVMHESFRKLARWHTWVWGG